MSAADDTGIKTGERSTAALPTEEMIEAGAEVIWARFSDATGFGGDEGRDVACAVFLAMADRAPKHAKS